VQWRTYKWNWHDTDNGNCSHVPPPSATASGRYSTNGSRGRLPAPSGSSTVTVIGPRGSGLNSS